MLRFTISEAVDYFGENDPRGEMVIVIEGVSPEEHSEQVSEQWQDKPLQEHMDVYLAKGLSEKDAMKAVAKDLGVSKREIYDELKIRKES